MHTVTRARPIVVKPTPFQVDSSWLHWKNLNAAYDRMLDQNITTYTEKQVKKCSDRGKQKGIDILSI
jgi:hypothetical protein